ncbi:MAG: hypothetical protein KTR16_16595 [Acidiferrobacterales bacterium]|nr:hypothetical protein [Acidiferrobacterales bacterium]
MLIGRRTFVLGLAASSSLPYVPSKWSKPIINSVVSPAHAQTSDLTTLCADGTSLWLMSDYVENGMTFTQGNPQSQVEITVSGTSVSLVTDWFVLNDSSSASSRGRVTDQGSIDLTTGEVSTNPTGNPVDSPTHGAVTNLSNNLEQSFVFNCSSNSDVIVSESGGLYSFRLSRIS